MSNKVPTLTNRILLFDCVSLHSFISFIDNSGLFVCLNAKAILDGVFSVAVFGPFCLLPITIFRRKVVF